MIKHINKIAIEVLRDRFADYDWHSNHYDEDYKMIVKALGLAKNNESLHLVMPRKILTQEWYEDSEEKTGWIGSGWNEPEGYEIDEVLDYDKNSNPIEAIFKYVA